MLNSDTASQIIKAHPVAVAVVGILSSILTILGFAWVFGRRLLVALIRWARSVFDEARGPGSVAATKLPPNLIVTTGGIRQVSLDGRLIWGPFTTGDIFRTAFIGQFTNRAHQKYRVQGAQSVRARVTLSVRDLPNRGVNCDPAPWLSAAHPTMPFGVGETRDLILAFVDYPNLPSLEEEPGPPESVIYGIRDHRDKAIGPAQSYEYTGALAGRVLANVMLTVDGYSKGPFCFVLDPGNPANPKKSPPKCLPIAPPSRLATLAAKFRAWRKPPPANKVA